MPLTAASLAADARAMCEDFPQPVTISRPGRGRFSCNAAVDMAGGGETLADDGAARFLDATTTVTVVADDCAWLPQIGDRVHIGTGRAYRVAAVRGTPGDPCLTLNLEAWL